MRQNQRFTSLFLFLSMFTFIVNCDTGSVAPEAISPVSFQLERPGTNDGKNAILFVTEPGTAFLVKLSGQGFSSDQGFEEFVEVPERIELSIGQKGKTSILVELAYQDGTPYLNETFDFEYSIAQPKNAVISFFEEATSDGFVFVTVGGKDKYTTELWLEGDVLPPLDPAGSWVTLNRSNKVPVNLTPEDGVKKLKAKLRNIYGSETVMVDLSIVKKSTPPQNCKIEPISYTAQSDFMKFKVSADNEGPLYYRILGDVADSISFVKFEGSVKVGLKLTKQEGEKNLRILIKDAAENFCKETKLKLLVDPEHKPINVSIKGKPYYVEEPTVTVVPYYEAFSDEPIEMYIEGYLEEGPNTFQWIPMGEVDIELQTPYGNRFVYITYRDANGAESPRISTPVYLQPQFSLRGSSAPYYLSLSNMVGLDSITVNGCSEAISGVAYSTTIQCTPNASVLQAIYTFEDGSVLEKTLTPP